MHNARRVTKSIIGIYDYFIATLVNLITLANITSDSLPLIALCFHFFLWAEKSIQCKWSRK